MTENSSSLVAACGLYCGACGAYLKKKCSGCAGNVKATWCKVRSCCAAKAIASCAACKDVADYAGCRKLNNVISKIIGLLIRSDRLASVRKLRELGAEKYAAFMSEQKLQSLKRK